MHLSLQLASELKGAELQCPVNLPSKMLIEGDRPILRNFTRSDYAMKELDHTLFELS